MSAPNIISIEKLVRLIGTPKCPILVDVRPPNIFEADPHLIPSSFHCKFDEIADEMADLMMTAGKEVEQHIIRLAQKAWQRSPTITSKSRIVLRSTPVSLDVLRTLAPSKSVRRAMTALSRAIRIAAAQGHFSRIPS
jgi:hypothetical protein